MKMLSELETLKLYYIYPKQGNLQDYMSYSENLFRTQIPHFISHHYE